GDTALQLNGDVATSGLSATSEPDHHQVWVDALGEDREIWETVTDDLGREPEEGQHERDDQRDEGNSKAAELGDSIEEGHHRKWDEVARHEETTDMGEQDEDAPDPQALSSQGHADARDRLEPKDGWVERTRCQLSDAGQRKDPSADRAVHGKWWESANPFDESAEPPHGRTLRRRRPGIITLQGRRGHPRGVAVERTW